MDIDTETLIALDKLKETSSLSEVERESLYQVITGSLKYGMPFDYNTNIYKTVADKFCRENIELKYEIRELRKNMFGDE